MSGFWTEAQAGALFFLGLTLFLLAMAGLTAYESWALNRGHEPITQKVRTFAARYPWWAGAIVFSLGYLAGHLFSPG